MPKHYLCFRADAPLTIDGRLDKAAWELAPWTVDFVDIEGEAQPQPPFRTRVKMLWDDDYLYIGAELEEPHVWGTLTEHDAVIFQDNDFEIFIDPDGDNHDYYEIEINALNTVWDLRLVKPYRDGGPALNSWEMPGYKSAVHINGTLNEPRDRDIGWSVEMALPWAVLGEFANCAAPPAAGDQWRINFSRVEWDITIEEGCYRKVPDRPEHNWVWSPQGVVDMHQPERWGYVQFSTAPTEIFTPDPSAQARDYLMQVYSAQQEYRKTHGHWATLLADLPLPSWQEAALAAIPQIAMTEDGYIATLEYQVSEHQLGRVHIRQDSRLWIEALNDSEVVENALTKRESNDNAH